MARQVLCQKYQESLEGLPVPPYKGPRGEWIYENISRKAWMEWLQHQTRLINEKGLSMIKAEDRDYLMEQMEKFFRNEDVEQAEGYVPPKDPAP